MSRFSSFGIRYLNPWKMCRDNVQKYEKCRFRMIKEGQKQGAKMSEIQVEKAIEIEIKIKLKRDKCK